MSVQQLLLASRSTVPAHLTLSTQTTRQVRRTINNPTLFYGGIEKKGRENVARVGGNCNLIGGALYEALKQFHVVQVLSYGYELRGWLHETSKVQYLNTHIAVVHVGPKIVEHCMHSKCSVSARHTV